MTDWRDKIRNPDCELCPLHEDAEYVCLMGSGTRKAKIMLIGEAPGAREDEEHQAFVGAAGQVLTRMLKEHAGLDRKDVYITNVAKCRPPGNRTPELQEMKTCVSNYLLPEIEAVDPKYVLLLGNAALRGVIGKSGITKHRGTRWDLGDFVAMATFHPAAMLRNPKYGESIAADLTRFGQLARGVDLQPKTAVKVIRRKGHLKWLLRQLDEAEAISYDIETNGLAEWKPDSRIVSIAFSWEEGQAAFVPLRSWPNPLAVLQMLMERLRGKKTIAHNGKFDARWLAQFGAPVEQTFDTMLAAHMIDENRSKGLKNLAQVILNAYPYDLGEELKDAEAIPLRKLAVYNGKDSDYTLRLYNRFRQDLMEEPRVARVFKFVMMPASNMLVDIERRGIQLDQQRLTERTAEALRVRGKIERAMLKHVPAIKREEMNFNSPPKVGEWLFDDLGLDPIEYTEKGQRSTKESVLLQLSKENKLAAALLKWRKWNKYLTTYFTPWAERADEHGRLHPGYKLFGTVTGRLSSQDPNLQNVPRNPFMRAVFCAKPGHVFIEADYSQIELRIAAMLAHERRMLEAFARGEDMHLKTAVEVTGMHPDDVDKEIRKKAKAVNFGFLFTMGAEKFTVYAKDNYDVDFTLEEAERARSRFFETYPGLRPWHERQRRLARRYHRVSSPLGRVRHLPDIVSKDKGVANEAERHAINSPVQSTASDLMLISALLLEEKGIPVIGLVHDAGLFEVAEDDVDRAAPLIKRVMEEDTLEFVKKKFGADITVPIVADVEIGTHWSEGEAWNG